MHTISAQIYGNRLICLIYNEYFTKTFEIDRLETGEQRPFPTIKLKPYILRKHQEHDTPCIYTSRVILYAQNDEPLGASLFAAVHSLENKVPDRARLRLYIKRVVYSGFVKQSAKINQFSSNGCPRVCVRVHNTHVKLEPTPLGPFPFGPAVVYIYIYAYMCVCVVFNANEGL